MLTVPCAPGASAALPVRSRRGQIMGLCRFLITYTRARRDASVLSHLLYQSSLICVAGIVSEEPMRIEEIETILAHNWSFVRVHTDSA